MRLLTAIVIALTGACGPSLKAKPVETRRYRAASGQCGQELASTTFSAKGYKWGESVSVEICYPADRQVEVRAAVHSTSGSTFSSVGPPPRDEQPNRCRLVEGERATAGSPQGGGSSEDGNQTGGSSTSAATVTRRQPVLVRENATGRACPWMNHATSSIDLYVPPVAVGTPIEVQVWSTRPIDVEGLVVDLTHNITKPNVSDEEWRKHLARKRRKRERKAPRDRPTRTEHSAEPWTPPPPAKAEVKPMPAPSRNASWIAGYWHWSGSDWHWVSGQWRIPISDYERGQTVTIHATPPAPRSETPGAPPYSNAAWIGGYWHWNGSQLVWIAGHWARAPRPGSTWQPHHWRRSGGEFVLVPGGWR